MRTNAGSIRLSFEKRGNRTVAIKTYRDVNLRISSNESPDPSLLFPHRNGRRLRRGGALSAGDHGRRRYPRHRDNADPDLYLPLRQRHRNCAGIPLLCRSKRLSRAVHGRGDSLSECMLQTAVCRSSCTGSGIDFNGRSYRRLVAGWEVLCSKMYRPGHSGVSGRETDLPGSSVPRHDCREDAGDGILRQGKYQL